MENIQCKNIGDLIKEARKELGFSMRELADKTGLSSAIISKYEAGKRFPKIEQANKLAVVLGIPPQSLIDNYYISDGNGPSNEMLPPIFEYLHSQGIFITHNPNKKSYTVNTRPYSRKKGRVFSISEQTVDSLNQTSLEMLCSLMFLVKEPEKSPSEK